MNNHIPIYWRTPSNIESPSFTLMYHNRTPHLGLLVLLHPFAATGIDQSQPAGRGVSPHKRKSYFLPIACFAILLYNFLIFFFGTHACTPRGLIAVIYPSSSTSSSSSTMYHFGLSSLVLGAPFSGFRSSFYQLQIIDNTHAMALYIRTGFLVIFAFFTSGRTTACLICTYY